MTAISGTHGGCGVCGRSPCPVQSVPEPPPFAVVRLRTPEGDSLWFNTPQSLNWNWYSPAKDGSWCWTDLEHAADGGALVEVVQFDYDLWYWGCDGFSDYAGGRACTRIWTRAEMAALVPGNPSSAPTCLGCWQEHSWPHPREVYGA